MSHLECKKVFYISNSKNHSNELLNELSKSREFKIYYLGKHYNQQLKMKQQYCDIYNLTELNNITLGAECVIFHPLYLNDDKYETILSNYDLILADNIIQTCKKNHVRRIIWITTKYDQHELQEHIHRIECEYAKILKSSNVELIQLQLTPLTKIESIQKAVEFLINKKSPLGSVYAVIDAPNSLQENKNRNCKRAIPQFLNFITDNLKMRHDHKFLDKIEIPEGFYADSLTFAFIHWLRRIPKYILNVEKNKNIISFNLQFLGRPLLVVEHNYLKSHRELQTFSILGGLLVKNRNKGNIIIREIPNSKYVMISVENFDSNLPALIYHWFQVPLQNLILIIFQRWALKISKESHSFNQQADLSLEKKSI